MTWEQRIKLLKLVDLLRREAKKGVPAWFSPAEMNEIAAVLEEIARTD